MEAKGHFVIVDSDQALFVKRSKVKDVANMNISSEQLMDSIKLDEVGLAEIASLPADSFKFLFLFSASKREMIVKIRETNLYLQSATFEEIHNSSQQFVEQHLKSNQNFDVTVVSHKLNKFPMGYSIFEGQNSPNRILFSGFAQDPFKRRKLETESYASGLVDYHISSLTQIASAIQFITQNKLKNLQEKIINIGYYFDHKKVHQILSYGILRANYPFRYTPIDFILPHEQIPFDSSHPIDVILHKFQDFYKETTQEGMKIVSVKENNILKFIEQFSNKVGIIDDIWKYNAPRTRISTTQEILRIISLPEVAEIVSRFPNIKISTPKILMYHKNENNLESTIEQAKSQMQFPVLIKTVEASSTSASHKMAIIHNIESLSNFLSTSPLCEIGIIIQELINHGGVINKLYVAGEYSVIQPRVSIPDLDSSKYFGSNEAIWLFDSQKPFSGQLPIQVPDKPQSPISTLDQQFMKEFSQAFRKNIGLNLFGYDVIQKTDSIEYYIVDVNCFPGFKNIPNLVDVFQKLFLFSIPKQI